MNIPVKKTRVEREAEKTVEGQFNHSLTENDLAACGIYVESFKEKNGKINEIISNLDNEGNFVSQLTEKFEETFSPREISYMAAKMAYVQMVNEFMAQGGNRAVPQETAQQTQEEEG